MGTFIRIRGRFIHLRAQFKFPLPKRSPHICALLRHPHKTYLSTRHLRATRRAHPACARADRRARKSPCFSPARRQRTSGRAKLNGDSAWARGDSEEVVESATGISGGGWQMLAVAAGWGPGCRWGSARRKGLGGSVPAAVVLLSRARGYLHKLR